MGTARDGVTELNGVSRVNGVATGVEVEPRPTGEPVAAQLRGAATIVATTTTDQLAPGLSEELVESVVAVARPALTTSLVIPTWNEAGNIGHVLRDLDRFDDIVIVDGCSDDDTVAIAKAVRPDVRVVVREPRGKGDALRAGFEAATGDVVVMLDADGSMDPREVDVFTAMIAVGFDLVKGSRLACGGGSHDLTLVRWMGNRALCGLANMLFDTTWTDLCYGYLAFRRDCLDRLALTADGFEIESQILANAALAGMRVAEVPSIEMPRISGDSHLSATRDGYRVLRTMMSARFSPKARRSAMALRPMPHARAS